MPSARCGIDLPGERGVAAVEPAAAGIERRGRVGIAVDGASACRSRRRRRRWRRSTSSARRRRAGWPSGSPRWRVAVDVDGVPVWRRGDAGIGVPNAPSTSCWRARRRSHRRRVDGEGRVDADAAEVVARQAAGFVFADRLAVDRQRAPRRRAPGCSARRSRPSWLPGSVLGLESAVAVVRPSSACASELKDSGRPLPPHWIVRDAASSSPGSGMTCTARAEQVRVLRSASVAATGRREGVERRTGPEPGEPGGIRNGGGLALRQPIAGSPRRRRRGSGCRSTTGPSGAARPRRRSRPTPSGALIAVPSNEIE